jgi:hypothetical protein
LSRRDGPASVCILCNCALLNFNLASTLLAKATCVQQVEMQSRPRRALALLQAPKQHSGRHALTKTRGSTSQPAYVNSWHMYTALACCSHNPAALYHEGVQEKPSYDAA